MLNSVLSVAVPEQQSGNPGDFLTYVLTFQNRSNLPIDLQVEYLTEDWELIGDGLITIPAHRENYYFPLTVIIPHHAPANFLKKIEVRFKIYGQPFTLPPVSIPVFVNPVSTINFTVPPSQKGLNGSTVVYNLSVTNNGNTTESISVTGVSENDWPLEIEPVAFELYPEESRTITVKHQIPGFTETDYDPIKLQFSWGDQRKEILLTTGITDRYDKMTDGYYIWQGQVYASHPNLKESESIEPNLSFFLNGQWRPDGDCQFYFSDILNEPTRSYYTHFKTDAWDVKAGKFPLIWQGLIAPKNSNGNLRAARADGDRSFAVYVWEPEENTSDPQPFGLEAYLNKNFRISLLNDDGAESDQNILELNYRTDLNQGFRWSNSLAYNASNSNGHAVGFGIDRYRGSWYLSSELQAFKDIADYLDKKRFQITLYQPFSDEKLTIYNQFIYENRAVRELLEPDLEHAVIDYDDYYFQTLFHWPSGLNFRLSYQYQLANGSFSMDNISVFLEDEFEKGRYQNIWWLSHSVDRSEGDVKTDYSKFNWETEYALNKNQELVFNPQIVSNSISSENESKLGLGFNQRLKHNSLEWKSILFRHFTDSSKFSLESSLDWRLYQYQLSLKYVGIWESSAYHTDTLSLVCRKKFSIPVKKPLGAVEGVAFLDLNQNNSFDEGEPPLRKAILILDETTTFETDEQGRYGLYGLTPGEHRIALDPLYEVIYVPPTPFTTVSVQQYQTVRLDLPFIRSQNISGTIYFDQNANGRREPGEPILSGIPIILKNSASSEATQAYSNSDGQFTFYQLAPGKYQFAFDEDALPDHLQPPGNLDSIIIDTQRLDETTLLEIGLIPFERPIEIVKEDAGLLLAVDRELAKPGDTLIINIESGVTLTGLELHLPTGERIQLADSPNLAWKYQWKLPLTIPTGQFKIECRGVDIEGKTHTGEVILVIIR
ncbi:MAG: hypothetical protein GX075_06685 [Firmicutes bacterium]|nr:hypothetical protein [Bacillota bacterium]